VVTQIFQYYQGRLCRHLACGDPFGLPHRTPAMSAHGNKSGSGSFPNVLELEHTPPESPAKSADDLQSTAISKCDNVENSSQTTSPWKIKIAHLIEQMSD